jgi:hypothetical protein
LPGHQSPDARLTAPLALRSGATHWRRPGAAPGASIRAVRHSPPGGADGAENASGPSEFDEHLRVGRFFPARAAAYRSVGRARHAGAADPCRVSGLSTLTVAVWPWCAARLCVFAHTSVATVTSQVLSRRVCRSPHTAQMTVARVRSVMATACHCGERTGCYAVAPPSPDPGAPIVSGRSASLVLAAR